MYGFNNDKSKANGISAERLFVRTATISFSIWSKNGTVQADALAIASPASLGYTGVNVLAVSAKEPSTGKWADLPFPEGIAGYSYGFQNLGFVQEVSGDTLRLIPYRTGDSYPAVTARVSVVILYV